jgi:hypothetical protein
MELTHRERGANVRRNLRRWRKPLLWMMAGWILLTLTVCTGAITYAHARHFTERRIQMLAESCGVILCFVLVASWLTVFILADRRKAE